MSRTRWFLVGIGVAVAALVVAGVVVTRGVSEPLGPGPEVDAYLRAWERFDLAAMAAVTTTPDAVGPAVTAQKEQLGLTELRVSAGTIVRDGDQAQAPFTAEADLAGLGTWTFDGRLE